MRAVDRGTVEVARGGKLGSLIEEDGEQAGTQKVEPGRNTGKFVEQPCLDVLEGKSGGGQSAGGGDGLPSVP